MTHHVGHPQAEDTACAFLYPANVTCQGDTHGHQDGFNGLTLKAGKQRYKVGGWLIQASGRLSCSSRQVASWARQAVIEPGREAAWQADSRRTARRKSKQLGSCARLTIAEGNRVPVMLRHDGGGCGGVDDQRVRQTRIQRAEAAAPAGRRSRS